MFRVNPLYYFAGLYAGSAALLKAIGFLFFLWLARTLPVKDYAAWGIFYALQTGVATFAPVGITESVSNLLRQYRSSQERQDLFAGASCVFLLTGGGTLIIATVLGLLVFRQIQIDIITLGSVLASGWLLAYTTVQTHFARVQEEHLSSLYFSFLVPAVSLLFSIIFFLLDRSVRSFFLGAALGASLSTFGLWFTRIGHFGLACQAGTRVAILSRLVPYIAVTFFGWLNGYGNNFIVNYFFSPTEVARFTFVVSIGAIMQLVATALNQVWSPRFFQIVLLQPINMVEEKSWRFFTLQSIALGTAGAFVILFLPPMLKALGGNLAFYSSMQREIFFIVAGYVFLVPWWHCHNYFIAYDKGLSVMHVTLFSSALGLILWGALMWLLGSLGIYAGFLMQSIVRSLCIVYIAKRTWSVKISWLGVGLGFLLIVGSLLFIIKE
jgi:O-antigen/teichoic acid export membrane protein